jgi:hypothetical protein
MGGLGAEFHSVAELIIGGSTHGCGRSSSKRPMSIEADCAAEIQGQLPGTKTGGIHEC